MRTIYYIFLFLLISRGSLFAQVIRGTVTDTNEEPVEFVAVVIQTMDSLFVDAVVTDEQGTFTWERKEASDYCLLFQHLLYEPVQQEIASTEGAVTIQLRERTNELGEIVIKGERPLVKAEGGKLTYDVPALIRDKTSTNAFEVIKELPGIISREENLQLAGARSLHIVLNGQLTSMTPEQMTQLLKSVPASRVQSAEVMYNAPAKYNVKGALINIVLEQDGSEKPVWQGEAGADYLQKHYAGGEAHVNLLYTSPRLNLDFLANGKRVHGFSGEDIWAAHTLSGKVTEVDQYGRAESKGWKGTTRLGMDYTFTNDDRFSAVYYYTGYNGKSDGNAQTVFMAADDTENPLIHRSNRHNSGTDALHNIRMQYDGHAGWQLGADYTNYRDPSDLYYLDKGEEEEIVMYNQSKQNISRWNAFANHTVGFSSGWSLNYGANGGYTSSKNFSGYAYDTGEGYVTDPEKTEDNKQKEYSASLFAETSKDFGRLSLTAALKGEYFKSDYNSEEERITLWEDWALFPTLSLNYMFSPSHILQLNVSSDKIYPSYWAVSPREVPINSYSVVVGNPKLKPYRSYEGQLVYIFRQKYMLIASYEYEPDYFVQVPYQSDSEMKNIFRYENFNYQKDARLILIAPFNAGSFWSGRVTLIGSHMKEKNDHFNEISFNRKANVGYAIMSNTFNLSNNPNIKMTIDGMVVSKGAIQGVYDLGEMYQVSAGLKYTFAKERATLTLNANDIFRSGMPTAKVNQDTQQSRMKVVNDGRYVKLSFAYKFGGYKAKEYKKVDTSRFGQ